MLLQCALIVAILASCDCAIFENSRDVSGGHLTFYNASLEKLKAPLPRVFVLNQISGKFDVKTPKSNHAHSQDQQFAAWFGLNIYEKVSTNGNESDLYFVPAFQPSGLTTDGKFWDLMDKELAAIPPYNGFALDKSFIAATQPSTAQQEIHNHRRNIMDLRYLRSDNDRSPNARDVYVPYVYDGHVMQQTSSDSGLHQKKHFICGVCREAGGLGELQRNWRTQLFKLWQNVPNSLIKQDFSEDEMVKAYHTSDFCLILPGDTSSTMKLYKAIFAHCIPVIFVSFPGQLPFYSILDWSKFSVVVYKDLIHSASGMQELLTLLTSIRDDPQVLRSYKQALWDAGPLFDYRKSDWPSVYHLTLLTLITSTTCQHSNALLNSTAVLGKSMCF